MNYLPFIIIKIGQVWYRIVHKNTTVNMKLLLCANQHSNQSTIIYYYYKHCLPYQGKFLNINRSMAIMFYLSPPTLHLFFFSSRIQTHKYNKYYIYLSHVIRILYCDMMRSDAMRRMLIFNVMSVKCTLTDKLWAQWEYSYKKAAATAYFYRCHHHRHTTIYLQFTNRYTFYRKYICFN